MTPDIRTLAVFARNWQQYLEEATVLSGRNRSRRLTYQSRQRWVTVASALSAVGPRTIYFAEIGAGPRITHVAEIVDVEVDPSRRNARTRRLLALRPPDTKAESLLARTLYAIPGSPTLSH